MNANLSDPAFWSRFQFGFTLTYHYLFPQLTMGLAWFLVYWKWRALRTGDERSAVAARFGARIFGLNFAVRIFAITKDTNDKDPAGNDTK